MHRLFAALRPPRAMREALLAIMDGVPHARWQDDEQLYVTLRFIGEVDRRTAEDVAHALGRVHVPALSLRLDGVGRFDRSHHGGALWAGVSPRDGVAALHRKVDRALVAAGLPPEGRAYLPHVTIARLSRGAGPVEPFLAVHAGLAGPAATFDRFHLYESRLGSEGAAYEIVASYPLD